MLDRTDPRLINLRQLVEEQVEQFAAKLTYYGFDEGHAVDAACSQVRARLEGDLTGLPEFDRFGYLPPIYVSSAEELLLRFGCASDRRRQLFRLVDQCITLGRQVSATRLLVDGGFVTSKEQPRDVDLVMLVGSDFARRVAAGDSAAGELWRISETGQPERLYLCAREVDWWGWYRLFSSTRGEEPQPYKGLVEVKL